MRYHNDPELNSPRPYYRLFNPFTDQRYGSFIEPPIEGGSSVFDHLATGNRPEIIHEVRRRPSGASEVFCEAGLKGLNEQSRVYGNGNRYLAIGKVRSCGRLCLLKRRLAQEAEPQIIRYEAEPRNERKTALYLYFD